MNSYEEQMLEKECSFRCAYCGATTNIIVKIPDTPAMASAKRAQLLQYCKDCNSPNIINVPGDWDFRPLVLGDEDDFLGYSDGIPILQGHKS